MMNIAPLILASEFLQHVLVIVLVGIVCVDVFEHGQVLLKKKGSPVFS
ncbi:MAG: hypothetical protein WDN67_02805 [Candidatus Moraniibacteriota bacterium]